MPSVINLTENKRSTPAHDEWATIGVHLATRVAQGQTREQAVAAVAALGVPRGGYNAILSGKACATRAVFR